MHWTQIWVCQCTDVINGSGDDGGGLGERTSKHSGGLQEGQVLLGYCRICG